MVQAFAIAGRDEPATLQDVPLQAVGPGQARVAVEAATINGFDVMIANGYLWDAMPHTFPVGLGRDFAGTVAEVGPDVTSVSLGDRVAAQIAGGLGQGSIAQELVVDAAGLVPVPAELTSAQAAAVGLAGVTAFDLIRSLNVGPDDVVLVSGATGGVGAYAVQLAAAAGATVLATARPEDTDFVRSLGADAAVDHTADLAAEVRAEAPEGVTAIVHAAGDAAVLGGLLRPGGKLASVLSATPEQVGRDDVTVIPVMAKSTPDKVRDLLDRASTGSLHVPIAETYPLDEAPKALEAFGAHKQGKVVVAIG